VNDERTPVDQAVELLIYAPIGLFYERDELVPRLVRRGRSQVQLARVLGQLAVRQGQTRLEDHVGGALVPAGAGLARLLTEVGSRVGLAPPRGSDAAGPPAADPAPEPPGPPPLPIAGYDQLPARVIITLLLDLTPAQRRVVRDHEEQHRRRKTILHQIGRLGG
jgi:hypothetical protein